MPKKIKITEAQAQAEADLNAAQQVIADDVARVSCEVITLHGLEDTEAGAVAYRSDQITHCDIVFEKTRTYATTQAEATEFNKLVAKHSGLDLQTVKNMTSYSVQIASNPDARAEAEAAGVFKPGKLYKLSTIASKIQPLRRKPPKPKPKPKPKKAKAKAKLSLWAFQLMPIKWW